MKLDQQTIDFYNLKSSEYSSWSFNHNKDDLLSKFLDKIKERSNILDLGCGAGHDSYFFASKGFSVTALDASKNLLSEVPFHSNIEIVNSDFISFQTNHKFNGIWSSFSLQHIPKKYFQNTLKLILQSLNKGGVFYIGIHEGNKEVRDSLGRFYSFYREKEILDILKIVGLQVFDLIKDKSESYDGEEINIMHIFLKYSIFE